MSRRVRHGPEKRQWSDREACSEGDCRRLWHDCSKAKCKKAPVVVRVHVEGAVSAVGEEQRRARGGECALLAKGRQGNFVEDRRCAAELRNTGTMYVCVRRCLEATSSKFGACIEYLIEEELDR